MYFRIQNYETECVLLHIACIFVLKQVIINLGVFVAKLVYTCTYKYEIDIYWAK